MEEFIMRFAESTVTGACLIYLLYYVVKNMEKITCTLERVSDTLLKIDMRVELLESRIKELEKEGVLRSGL